MTGHVQLTKDDYDALMRDIDAQTERLARWSRRAMRLNAEVAEADRKIAVMNAHHESLARKVASLTAENARLRRESLFHTAIAHDLEERLADHLPDPAPGYEEP